MVSWRIGILLRIETEILFIHLRLSYHMRYVIWVKRRQTCDIVPITSLGITYSIELSFSVNQHKVPSTVRRLENTDIYLSLWRDAVYTDWWWLKLVDTVCLRNFSSILSNFDLNTLQRWKSQMRPLLPSVSVRWGREDYYMLHVLHVRYVCKGWWIFLLKICERIQIMQCFIFLAFGPTHSRLFCTIVQAVNTGHG